MVTIDNLLETDCLTCFLGVVLQKQVSGTKETVRLTKEPRQSYGSRVTMPRRTDATHESVQAGGFCCIFLSPALLVNSVSH